MEHAPLILRPQLDAATVRWLVAMLRNCTKSRYALNKSRMVRLADYSLDCLVALRAETAIAYDQRSQGTLQLFRTQQQLDGVAKDVAVLQADGVAYEVLDAVGCRRAEPGLANTRDHIAGACACLATRQGTASCSPAPWRSWPPNSASSSSSRPRSPG